MPIIGRFYRDADGSFIGSIITLSVQSGNVRVVPVAGAAPDSPTHHVMVAQANIGEGRAGADGRVRLALDDPSFADAIEADLVEQPDGAFSLVWHRRGRAPDG